jgi:hypothetical protein
VDRRAPAAQLERPAVAGGFHGRRAKIVNITFYATLGYMSLFAKGGLSRSPPAKAKAGV